MPSGNLPERSFTTMLKYQTICLLLNSNLQVHQKRDELTNKIGLGNTGIRPRSKDCVTDVGLLVTLLIPGNYHTAVTPLRIPR